MFELHHKLAADTVVVHDSDNLLLLLANDARYPWLILVPKIEGVRELYQLSADAQQQFHQISATLGEELMALFQGDKFNLAALGNEVPQLHVHHVVRLQTDEAWPAPIWGRGEAVAYTADEQAACLKLLRAKLSFCR